MTVASVFPRLESRLPSVQKPIQYVGGELNSVVKDWHCGALSDEGGPTVRWALMYPDAYEVGLPNQGVQILYEVLNERADALAERTYAVWPDLEALMREHGVPQFTVDSLPGQTDPYRSAAALPTAEVTYVQRNYSSGNKDLLPVESTGKSVGVVVDVPWIKGLSITADYWQIKQENEISIRSASQILNRDSQLLRDYVASQLAAGRTIAQIDLGSGTAGYKGDPNVVRLAPTAEDVALFNAANAGKPAAQQLPVVGRIFSRTAKFENLAVAQTSGIDMSLNYNLPALPIGRLTLATDWSYLIESNQVRTPPGAAQQYIERMDVGGTTRWTAEGVGGYTPIPPDGVTSLCNLPGPVQFAFLLPDDVVPTALDVTNNGQITVRLVL